MKPIVKGVQVPFLFAAILLLCYASAALAQAPSIAVPSTLFGNTIMYADDWPSIPIGALGKGAGVTWPYDEPSRGEYTWTRLDEYVGAATAAGVTITFSSESVPAWAASNKSSCYAGFYGAEVCKSGVTNIQDWENFVTALVTRYKGRIQVYELWNEPQNDFTGTMAQLVSMTNTEDSIIRSIDPAAKILSPSMISYGYPYLAKYFAAGGTKNIDAVAMHAYPNPSNDVAEFIEGSVTTGMKSVMSEYGLSSKPLWDTESSWGQASAGAIANSELRAAFVARDYLLHWSVGIQRVYWYSWDNPDDGTLWSSGGGVDQAGIAYKEIYKWMEGATMSTCSQNGATSFYHAVYTCNLARSGGYKAQAVWYTDGNKTYSVPAGYTEYLDLQGNVHDIPSNRDVTIGIEPILLQN